MRGRRRPRAGQTAAARRSVDAGIDCASGCAVGARFHQPITVASAVAPWPALPTGPPPPKPPPSYCSP
eukprot:11174644-Lingulodinium_polyedra.AAC.1